MIRINLLEAGGRRPKTGKAMPEAFAVSAPPTVAIGVGVVVLALLALGGHYFLVQRAGGLLQARLTAARQESARLQGVRREFEENTKQRELLTQRISVIDDLKSNQSGPSALLEAIRHSVDGTPSVWLTSVGEKAGVMDVEGSALSLNAVADLMTAMKSSGYFRQIDLHESVQTTGKNGPNPFTFSLTVTPASAGAATDAGPGTAAGQRS